MITKVDPWHDFGPYAMKIAGHCRYLPGMQVYGTLTGACVVGRLASEVASGRGVLLTSRYTGNYGLSGVSDIAPDLSDDLTRNALWPVLRKHLTADEIIKLRALATKWSMEPWHPDATDTESDTGTDDNDHD